DAFYVRGVNHNISFLAAIATHKRFRDGRLSTGFIAEEFPGGFKGADLTPGVSRVLQIAAAVAQRRTAAMELAAAGQVPGHRIGVPDRLTVKLNGNGGTGDEVILAPCDDGYDLTIGGKTSRVRTSWQPMAPLMTADVDGRSIVVQVD